MPATKRKYDTLADVLRDLGVPPRRVLWTPFPGTATEEDLLRRGKRDPLVELVDGSFVVKPASAQKSFVAAVLIVAVGNHVSRHKVGVVAGPCAPMRLAPGMVRMPDAAFTAWASLPTDDAHLQPVADFAPDLAVEVLSRDNTRREMARKRRDYFRRGTQLVWIIDPNARTVAVYTDARTHTVLTAADTLTGGAVLPGFALPLAEFFNDPQLQPRPPA
jgi:Uma2 family endonuclease